MATQLVCARALPVAHNIACAQLALPGVRSIDIGPGAPGPARRSQVRTAELLTYPGISRTRQISGSVRFRHAQVLVPCTDRRRGRNVAYTYVRGHARANLLRVNMSDNATSERSRYFVVLPLQEISARVISAVLRAGPASGLKGTHSAVCCTCGVRKRVYTT